MPLTVVLGGPPNTGKTCLQDALRTNLRVDHPTAPPLFVYAANPDGQGSWFNPAYRANPPAARFWHAQAKAGFTPEFTDRIAREVAGLALPLTLVDVGGRITDENRLICAGATHIVILARTADQFPAWREFAAELGLTVIAEIISSHEVDQDAVEFGADGVLRGVVAGLDREVDSSRSGMVRALADRFVDLLGASTRVSVLSADPFWMVRRGPVLQVGFGTSTDTDLMVKYVAAKLEQLEQTAALTKSAWIGLNGRISLALMSMLVPILLRHFTNLAVFHPPQDAYIVTVSNDPGIPVGTALRQEDFHTLFLRELCDQARVDGVSRCAVGAVALDQELVLVVDGPAGQLSVPNTLVEPDQAPDLSVLSGLVRGAGLQLADVLSYLGHQDFTGADGQTVRQFNFQVRTEPMDPPLTNGDETMRWVQLSGLDHRAVGVSNLVRLIGSNEHIDR